ncbi:hypothetical protein Scep_021517 [Stephania cephalantha]|uniref:DUF4283 domain-containing protein n=1 Tax=Stephania cephalantha TaxID=152367 RepID=A0AAP0F8N1_9MAGN
MQQIRLPLTTTWCSSLMELSTSRLGANAILAVSLAVCKAGASVKKVPLYKGAPTNHVADFEQDESDSDSDKQQKLVHPQGVVGGCKSDGVGPMVVFSGLEFDELEQGPIDWQDQGSGRDIITTMDENGPIVQISDIYDQLLDKQFEHAVVVKLLWRAMGYQMLMNRIKALWNPVGEYMVMDLGKDFFLVVFARDGDSTKALLGGPWVVLGQALSVQRWTPEFWATTTSVNEAAVWVRFLDLPIKYYQHDILWEVGSSIGWVLRIKLNTRRKYVRIAVELEFDKPLLSKIRLRNMWQGIEYKGLPSIRFLCGKVGHNSLACINRHRNTKTAQSSTQGARDGGDRIGTRNMVGDVLEREDGSKLTVLLP